ncbi:MAG: glycosyltransferase [Dehalococcoidales bacterium]|nr:glycosyltransferase [Dehalococcoidales bacterium]
MKDKPLVSVITPTLNNKNYLKECIESVLAQTYINIEHVIVDGVSTDGTVEMLAEYKAKYPGRIVYISERDKSAGDAWIKGVKIAKGDIFGWLGADDTYPPDAVATVVKYFNQNPDSYFVFGGCNYINEKGGVIKNVVTRDFDLKQAINDSVSIPCTSAFYRREVVEKVDPIIIAEQDSEIEYWIMVGKVFKINRIDPVLSHFRLYNEKARAHDDMISYARSNFKMGRRHGAGLFSPCARRYYLAIVMRPLQPVIDPIFHYMSTGDAERSTFLVKVTRPFHPAMTAVYHLIVGSKSSHQK